MVETRLVLAGECYDLDRRIRLEQALCTHLRIDAELLRQVAEHLAYVILLFEHVDAMT